MVHNEGTTGPSTSFRASSQASEKCVPTRFSITVRTSSWIHNVSLRKSTDRFDRKLFATCRSRIRNECRNGVVCSYFSSVPRLRRHAGWRPFATRDWCIATADTHGPMLSESRFLLRRSSRPVTTIRFNFSTVLFDDHYDFLSDFSVTLSMCHSALVGRPTLVLICCWEWLLLYDFCELHVVALCGLVDLSVLAIFFGDVAISSISSLIISAPSADLLSFLFRKLCFRVPFFFIFASRPF